SAARGGRQPPEERRANWSVDVPRGADAPRSPGHRNGDGAVGPRVPATSPGAPMPTEREKMLAGELYDPLDPGLVAARDRARNLCQDLNATREQDHDTRRRILRELPGAGGQSVWMH